MSLFRIFAAVALVLGLAVARPALAGERADAKSAVAQAAAVVEDIRADPNFRKDFDPLLKRARAVMVIPNFYKGGFIIGGAYGNGMLLVRDQDGRYSPPAFYTVAGGSLGLQIGGQRARMLLMIMTEAGLNAILSDQFKVGATAGVSFGTVGANLEGATTSNLDTDIVAFSLAQGAYGGAAIDGAAITVRADWNRAVYGPQATPRAILFDRRWPMAEADDLHRALTVDGIGGSAPVAERSPADAGASAASPAVSPEPMPSAAPAPTVERAPLIEKQSLDAPAPQPSYQAPAQPQANQTPAQQPQPSLQAPAQQAPQTQQEPRRPVLLTPVAPGQLQ